LTPVNVAPISNLVKPARFRGGFAGVEYHGTDSPPRPFWMDEEGSNLSGIVEWIEQIVFSR
jgi:hypothetical protein